MNVASERSPDPFVLVGSTLGEAYLLDGVIGCGSHGVLYSARNLRMSSRCVVKLLKLPPGSQRDALLVTLGGCAAAVHPNLTAPYDALPLPDGSLLLCSQLLDGEDLANRVALRGKLTRLEGRHLARQIAAALLALHRRGLAHGNLTARNVFLLRYDEVGGDSRLGDARGGQAVRLLDMGLGHCDGIEGNSADDQRAMALLLLEHIQDLSLHERRVLERAQAALPQVRFPSIQDFCEAFANDATTDANNDPRQTALTPSGGQRDEPGQGDPPGRGEAARRASTETAVVPRQKDQGGKSKPVRETLVVRRQSEKKTEKVTGKIAGRGSHTAQSGQSGFRVLWRSPAVLVGGGLAILLGIGAALLVERSRQADDLLAPAPMAATSAAAPTGGGRKSSTTPRPRSSAAKLGEVSLRFVVSPTDAEVQVGDDKLPTDKVLKVTRQKRPLPVVVQAAGHLPYEGEVIPDADRTINIALLPNVSRPPTAPSPPNPGVDPDTADEPGLGPTPEATGPETQSPTASRPDSDKVTGKRRRRHNKPAR